MKQKFLTDLKDFKPPVVKSVGHVDGSMILQDSEGKIFKVKLKNKIVRPD